jgi:predicted GIY-YIG superfamily endonuclease
MKKIYRTLTVDFCLNEAKKYSSRGDLAEKDQAVYNKLRDLKLLNTVFPFKYRENFDYSFEDCKRLASECETRNEFKHKYMGAWNKARHQGWMEEICQRMTRVGTLKKRLIYVYEFPNNVVYIGLTYDIKKRHKGHLKKGVVYNHSQLINQVVTPKLLTDYIDVNEAIEMETKLIIDYTNKGYTVLNKSNGGELGSIPLNKRNKEEVLYFATLCKSREDFKLIYPNHHAQARRDKYYDEVCSLLPAIPKTRTKEEIKKIVDSCETYKDFFKNYPNDYNYALRHNWIEELTLGIEKRVSHWVYEDIENVVKNFNSRDEFRQAHGGMYETARTNKWLDRLFQNLPSKRKIWEYSEIHNFIQENNIVTRTELNNINRSAYYFACRRKWLDTLIPQVKKNQYG